MRIAVGAARAALLVSARATGVFGIGAFARGLIAGAHPGPGDEHDPLSSIRPLPRVGRRLFWKASGGTAAGRSARG